MPSRLEKHLAADEVVTNRSRHSKAAIFVTWLAIPLILSIVFFSALPFLIQRVLSFLIRDTVSNLIESGGNTDSLFAFPGLPVGVTILIQIVVCISLTVWFLWALISTVIQLRNNLLLTETRLLAYSQGKTLIARVDEIQNAMSEQSLWGRLFSYGHITILTKQGAITVKNICDPEGWKRRLLLLIE